MRLGILPHVTRSPLSERAQLFECVAARQSEAFLRLKIGARLRLLAAQTSDPHVVGSERAKQWLHLAERATAVRRRLVEDAEFGFLLCDCALGEHINQIQFPLRSDIVAIRERLRKVVARFEKKNGNAR